MVVGKLNAPTMFVSGGLSAVFLAPGGTLVGKLGTFMSSGTFIGGISLYMNKGSDK